MPDNDNKRHFNRIVIAGLGGVGWWALTAILNDLAGVQVDAYDPDNFRGGNGHMRLPMPEDPKTLKVDAHQEFMRYIGRTHCLMNVTYRAEFAEGDEGDKGTLYLDCTDLHDKQRKVLFDNVVKSGATYLRGSYDGNGVGVVSPGLPFVTVEQGYGELPSFGQSLFAGGMVAMSVMVAMRTGRVPENQFQIEGSGM